MKDTPAQTPAPCLQLRRCILETLYGLFRRYPYAVVELPQIEGDCRTNTAELNWNLVYLEKCGYVELGKSIQSPPYIASSVSLTAGGIELVEDAEEFNRRFPPAADLPDA